MKKHQLLEKAMRDYPAGTVARFRNVNVDHVSTGQFVICDLNGDGETQVMGVDSLACFFISHDEDGRKVNEWAIPIPKSILTGKCAIQVNNEREFNLLMEHYEGKGWKVDPMNENAKYEHNVNYCCYDYHDRYRRGSLDVQVQEGYKIIPFKDFAVEIGIEVPVFVMTSEDGVPLYNGDKFFHVVNMPHLGWCLNTSLMYDDNMFTLNINNKHLVITNPDPHKAFASRGVAKKWIEQANRPKNIIITCNGGEIIVTKHTVKFNFSTNDREVSGIFFDKIVEARNSFKEIKP